MATCDHCGTVVDQPFTCNHCSSRFCGEHRLPESHECPMYVPDRWQGGASTSNAVGHHEGESGVEEPEPMDLSTRPSPGGSDVEPSSDSSPAVETRDEPRKRAPSDSPQSPFEGWKLSVETTGVRLRATTKNVVRLAGIALLLLAAYNTLLVPVYDVPSLAFYRFSETPVKAGPLAYLLVEDVAAALLGAAVAWFV